MSRHELCAIPFLVAVVPAPVFAQDDSSMDVTDPREQECRGKQDAARISGEIIVCGERSDDDRYRITADAEAERRYADATRDEGLALAPDFSPPPCKPTWLMWCPKLGGTPEGVVLVDVGALPEPVAHSVQGAE